MRILAVPDKLKGAVDAGTAARAIARGAVAADSSLHVDLCPAADGGDGTLRALLGPLGAQERRARVLAADGSFIDARWGFNETTATAIIESAEAVGLVNVPPARRDPMRMTSYGLGQLILAALDAGAQSIVIGLGGSATSDAGAGMAQALGARLGGVRHPATGADLARIDAIDASALDARVHRAELVIACDVDNPLTGEHGAALVYAPQKGASDDVARELDLALHRFSRLLPGADPDAPRMGAAGGLGFGLAAFLGARLVPGAELVLDAIGFDARLAETDLVITAEGKLDDQSRRGKVVAAVAKRASAADVPCLALAGQVTLELGDLRDMGLSGAFSICPGPMSLEQAMQRTEVLLESATARVVSVWLRARASAQR